MDSNGTLDYIPLCPVSCPNLFLLLNWCILILRIFLFIEATNWSIIQKLVIKLELLPNTEEIVYQTINVFGYISTSRVKIGELERTTMQDQYG